MNKYLKNPYVVLGVLGIAFYIYKRSQILKHKPQAKKSVKEIEAEEEAPTENTQTTEEEVSNMVDEEKVKIPIPKKLKSDVKKMDKHTIKRTILTNLKLLKKARLGKEEKDHIKNMLSFLKSEYKKRKNEK